MATIIDTTSFVNSAPHFNPAPRDVFPMQDMLRWPSLCHICRSWPSQPLCASCVDRFAQPTSRCPACALTLGRTRHSTSASLTSHCQHCVQHPSPLDACVAAVSYTFPWAGCIARFKFQADPSLARALAHLMRHAPWMEPALDATHIVVPMPLTPQRLRERGFNQALELARHLAPHKTHAHTLLRRGDSAPQVGASRQERFDRVRDAFWVAPERVSVVRGQRMVLVDDVMTTGASMHAAARALRAAGAVHITGVVLARTEEHEAHH
ncbi:phosphoribosyltransferase family protein [Limnohabitans sp.]|uniref:ComF family protein n=1 Tax=Limnohabitans sp. TaxID=1907725 RepID=UPI00286F4FFF|nr:phosphoribosyltransferase family protein [Limnohabitans sp.]